MIPTGNHLKTKYTNSFPLEELPTDITENILQRLSLGDRLPMKAVCKPWKHLLVSNSSVIRLFPEIPWLLVPESSLGGKIISFRSMSDNRVYGLKVPKPISSKPDLCSVWCCYGSSKGWLVMSNEVPDSYHSPMNLFLLNPISGATLNLPDLRSFPNARVLHDDLLESNFSMYMIKTIAVLTSAAEKEDADFSSLSVAAILADHHSDEECEELDYTGMLAICRPQADKVWTTFSGLENDCGYGDIFFHNGKLFIDTNRKVGDEIVDKIASKAQKDCDVKLELLCIDHCEDDNILNKYPFIAYMYFVESIHGELLIVTQIVEERDCKPVSFEVHKYRGIDEPLELIPSMDDQMIFLAPRGGSTCVAAERNLDSRFRGNQIYFGSKCGQDSLQVGVYDLKNRQLQLQVGPLVPCLPLPNPICWFTPSFDNN